MKKEEILQLMNENPAFFLGTTEGSQPRVRGMLLYKADSDGIFFHTGNMKDVYQQISQNPKAELCFVSQSTGVQVRVSGTLEEIKETSLKDEIVAHPSRSFLRPWKENSPLKAFYESFIVYRLTDPQAVTWSMASNFDPKTVIAL